MSIRQPKHRAYAVLVVLATAALSACGSESNPTGIDAEARSGNPPVLIELSRVEVDFAGVAGDTPPEAVELVISSADDSEISGLAVSASYAGPADDWLALDLESTTTPATLRVRPHLERLTEGEHTARVEIDAPETDSVRVVTVRARVEPSPSPARIMLSSDAVSLEMDEGGPPPDTLAVTISNGGELPLHGLTAGVSYDDDATGDWLSATLTDTTAPARLVLRTEEGALRPGRYTADVTLGAPGAEDVVLPVALEVRGVQVDMRLERSVLTLETSVSAPNPPVAEVDILGAGTLLGVRVAVEYEAGGPEGWLSPAVYDNERGRWLSVGYLLGALPEGTFRATVTLDADNADGPQSLSVTVDVGPPTGFLSTGGNVYVEVEYGMPDPEPIEVRINNLGTGMLGDLVAEVVPREGSEGDWVSVELAGTEAPTVLTIRLSTTRLNAGSYYADLTVSSPDAGNSPVRQRVTLVVTGGAPDLTVIGETPATQTVQPGMTITVPEHVIGNIGSASTAGDFQVGFYLSSDGDVTSDDPLLGEAGWSRLLPGERIDRPAWSGLEIPVGTPAGTYTIGVLVDHRDAIAESDETNNVFTLEVEVEVLPPGAGGRGG